MTASALSLLDRLIATPSLSRMETETAAIIEADLRADGIDTHRLHNNIWAVSDFFDADKPTLLLNSHHDTVRPALSYTLDPYTPVHRDGRIYGLGSNDAGGSVVSLVSVFKLLRKQKLNVNLILAITAEEEVSGANGIEALLKHFAKTGIGIDMAIVGEPTSLQAAVAERGLLVLDCSSTGVSGHAARNEGVNAIYKAIEDIGRLRNFSFGKRSDILGDIRISVTMVNAGSQHNVVPDRCDFVADIRTTDAYTNSETLALISEALDSEVKARSTRLNASVIDSGHPLVVAARSLGASSFVSPTMSDRALMHGIPALKIGPGDSARSHTADEFILESEIAEAINFYHRLITSL